MQLYRMFAFLLCMSFMNSILCQEVKVIDYLDLANAKLDDTFGINKKVRIRVANINRFLYKVTLDKSENDYNVTIPTILSGIKLPNFLYSELPGGNGVPSILRADNHENPSAEDLRKALKLNVATFLIIQQYVDNAVTMHNQIVYLSKSCDKPFTQFIEPTVKGILNNFLLTSSSSIDSLSNILMTELAIRVGKIEEFYLWIEDYYSQWKVKNNKQYKISQQKIKTSIALMKEKKFDFASQATQRKFIIDSLGIKAEELDSSMIDITLQIWEDNQAAIVADVNKLIENFRSVFNDLKKFREEGRLYLIVDDIKKINLSNYSFLTEEMKLTKDETKILISSNSDNLLVCNKPNNEKITVTLRTKGGIKLDFSTGVFLNFGSNEFHGAEYYYKSIDDSNSTIAMKDPGKRVGLAIGALLHIYKRSPSKVKIGAAIGASTTTGFDGMNFHIAPSLILGDKERICFSAGIVGREIKILDKSYNTGQVYNKKDIPADIPMVKRFPLTGLFISLTYNLSVLNK